MFSYIIFFSFLPHSFKHYTNILLFCHSLLWRQWGIFDKIIYLDSDHIVLHNIDRLFEICNDDLCAVNDPTQSVRKMWDQHYFNAGLMLLKPNDKDYFGLLDAIFNNSLTNSSKRSYDYSAFFDLDSFPKHAWFTGGKPGSLLEQDLLNIYFITRTTYLAPGYNIWAKKLNTFMIPGAFYETQKEVEKYVSPRVHVIHGNLWAASDGYGYNFPIEMRLLWYNFYKIATEKVYKKFIYKQEPKICELDDKITSCFLCEGNGTKFEADILECWLNCVQADI